MLIHCNNRRVYADRFCQPPSPLAQEDKAAPFIPKERQHATSQTPYPSPNHSPAPGAPPLHAAS